MVLSATIKNSSGIVYIDKEPNFIKIVWLFVSLKNIKLRLDVILAKAEVAS